MNWFQLLKIAMPYTEDICPICTMELCFDFQFEKGNEKYPFFVGRCPNCQNTLKITPTKNQEMLAFVYSRIEPISNHQFNNYLRHNRPQIKIMKGEEDTENSSETQSSFSL